MMNSAINIKFQSLVSRRLRASRSAGNSGSPKVMI